MIITKFKTAKLLTILAALLVVSCEKIDTNSSETTLPPLSGEILTTESTSLSGSEEISQSEIISSPPSEDISSLTSEQSEIISSENNETSSSDTISSVETQISEDVITSSEVETREPGIYLSHTRIGVAETRVVMIEHEVYPLELGTVHWELMFDDQYFIDRYGYPDLVTTEGEVTGVHYTGEELLIKGTLIDLEVYVTLTVFLDYDKHVDTFYPKDDLSSVIGTGHYFHNGTTKYARYTTYRPVHYYAYNLKKDMTFNIMSLTRYSVDRPYHIFETGHVVDGEFVVLIMPFISSDGKALLLGYDVTEDGEYIVRMRRQFPEAGDFDVSYIAYTFWF